MVTRKKPYTGEELFDIITKIIKEKNLYPKDIIEYCSPAYNAKNLLIKNYEFDINGVTMYGSNEGFYVDIILRGNIGTEDERNTEVTIGVIRTLLTDEESIHKMGVLATDYVIQGSDFINANLDDFTWGGYDVYIDGKAVFTCKTLERAQIRANEYRERYDYKEIKLFDNLKKKFIS